MARTLPQLGEKWVAEIEAEWGKPQEAWARQRLLVVRLIAQHELTVAQIMRVADVSRQTVFTYRDTLLAGGLEALLSRKRAPGRVPTVRGAVAQEFLVRLEAGKFRQARDAQAWIKKRTRQHLSESGVRQLLRRVGGKLKAPRKSHTKKDPAKAQAFKLELPARLNAAVGPAPTQPVRLWVLDEHRYGPAASDPPGVGSPGRAGSCALRHPLPVGLSPRSLGSGRGPCVRTVAHSGD